MALALTRILQRFSRIEPYGDLLKKNPRSMLHSGPGQKSTIAERVQSSRVRMKHNLVLMPVDPLWIRFRI